MLDQGKHTISFIKVKQSVTWIHKFILRRSKFILPIISYIFIISLMWKLLFLLKYWNELKRKVVWLVSVSWNAGQCSILSLSRTGNYVHTEARGDSTNLHFAIFCTICLVIAVDIILLLSFVIFTEKVSKW